MSIEDHIKKFGLFLLVVGGLVCLGFGAAYARQANETRYAPGFDSTRFHDIRPGDDATSVVAKLGQPIRIYTGPPPQRLYYPDGSVLIVALDGRVTDVEQRGQFFADKDVILSESSPIQRRYGPPTRWEDIYNREQWIYAVPKNGHSHFRAIVIVDLDDKKVVRTADGIHWD